MSGFLKNLGEGIRIAAFFAALIGFVLFFIALVSGVEGLEKLKSASFSGYILWYSAIGAYFLSGIPDVIYVQQQSNKR